MNTTIIAIVMIVKIMIESAIALVRIVTLFLFT
jgi:hypothetical protein